ncbi:cytochrome c-type biogenesis protein [Rhodovibrio salinarum]|nr:cytochrome c-type biogenesis protein [Rhodovibrio salinarum]
MSKMVRGWRVCVGVLVVAAVTAIAGVGPTLAVEPDEKLDDPKLEQRAQELGKEIRCLVCQSESIANSNADLAKDLRILVREKIQEGMSNAEIKDFLQARYGDYVLLRPPMKPETYVLWYGPAVVTALGALGIGVFFWRRQRRPAAQQKLSADEQRRLNDILGESDDQA